MAQVFLLPNTAVVGPGQGFFIGTIVTQANFEFAPNPTTGFSGTISIDSATSPSPIASDWFSIAQLVFNAHTTNLDINLYLSDNPWIRANITASSVGSIAVYMAY